MYDYLLDDWEDGGEEWTGRRCAPQPKTCMRCGATGLWWGTLGDGRWTLTARDGNPHICDTAASPDEFD